MKQETLKGKFTYDGLSDSYTATVRKPFCWWWLLLLLLPLLLFIRCDRDVNVTVKDKAGNLIENVCVELARGETMLSETTNSKGEVTFSDPKLSYNGWDYIFSHNEKIKLTATPPAPYFQKSVEEKFHSADNVVIILDEQAFDVQVKVIDALSKQPISGAEVIATANGSGIGTFTTSASGIATIPNVHESDRMSLAARAANYESNDSTLSAISGKELKNPPMKEIPLQKIYQCDDNVSFNSSATPVVEINNIDMHKDSGTFTLSVFTQTQPDQIMVFDDNGNKLLDTGLISTYDSWRDYTCIRFNTRKITIRVIADPNGPTTSIWEVHPHCPD